MLRVLLFVTFLGLLFRCPLYTAVCLLLAAGLALAYGPLARRRGRSASTAWSGGAWSS